MWVYAQKQGTLTSQSGNVVGTGYSGFGTGKNSPAMETVANVGPWPVGLYNLEAPVDTVEHGPYVLRLDPFAENNMHGRAGGLMHGDSIEFPGEASKGCLIFARAVRELVWASNDHQLQIIHECSPST